MPIVAPEETCYTFSMEKKGALGALREKRCNMRHVLTSEAVTRGHSAKLCDQVADGVLDALLTEDPEARAACEAAVWENHLLLFGEISARQEPDYEVVAREVLRDIAASISQALGVRAEKGYTCHTVGPRDGGNNITEFFNAVWRHKTTPLIT